MLLLLFEGKFYSCYWAIHTLLSSAGAVVRLLSFVGQMHNIKMINSIKTNIWNVSSNVGEDFVTLGSDIRILWRHANSIIPIHLWIVCFILLFTEVAVMQVLGYFHIIWPVGKNVQSSTNSWNGCFYISILDLLKSAERSECFLRPGEP